MKIIKTNEPILIKTNKFKKCILCLIFPIKKINQLEKNIMHNILFKYSILYNTDKKRIETLIKNNCISFNFKINNIGDTNFLEIHLLYPSYNAIKKDVLKKNLLFLKEMIYNPLLVNGIFDPTEINNIKETFKKSIKKYFDNSFSYYEYQNNKLIDEDGFLMDEFIENNDIINEITSESITNLYKDIIKHKPLVFLLGDVSNNDKNLIIETLLDNKIENVEIEKNYTHYFKSIPNEVIYKEEITNYETSMIFYNFKLINPCFSDRKLLLTVRKLFNSTNSTPLFDKLRLENDLVYKCGVHSSASNLTLTIWASTSKNNIEQTKNIIEDIIKNVSNKDYIKDHLELIKESQKMNYILSKEDINSILLSKIDKFIEFKEQSYYEDLKNLTVDDIYDFINKKMKLVSIYVGVGKNEN